MPVIARMIGGAGTGKTTWLMETMSRVLEAGIEDPRMIGFVSFTRAARREAAERAASRFGVSLSELESDGWFRTLHSVCYRALGCGRELLAGGKDDRKWIEDAVDEQIDGRPSDDEGMVDGFSDTTTDAGRALRIWDTARNRLVPLSAEYARQAAVDDDFPDLATCRGVVERYEQSKRLDGRMDFVDILGRFAGYRFTPDGPAHVAPEGFVPALPVWFLDEQQDTSPLLDAVCKRLIEPAQWVYVVGDAFQSVYGWAGCDGRLFMGWDVAKQGIMPKSYRCPPAIHELGEDILRECSDYFDRGIAPADHEGEVETEVFSGSLFDEINPNESWLVLARTNYHVARLVRMLRERWIPWLPTKGNGMWNSPARGEANESLWYLQQGLAVRGSRWRRVVDHLPAKAGGREFLIRGTKTEWAAMTPGQADERLGPTLLDDLPGVTAAGAAAIRSGEWRQIVDHGEEWTTAAETWGEGAVKNPKVRVGTIHSVKGAEADNVLWLTTLSERIRRGREEQEADDEERRLAYVAVTRARKRLIIAGEPNAYRFEVNA